MIKITTNQALKRSKIKYLVYLLLLSLPMLGSDCNNNNIIGGNNSGELVGRWQLSEMTGYLQDICYHEVVNFQSNGVAILQCPGEQAISRNYTVSSNVLTYTDTGVQYDITTLTGTTLVLTGRNNLSRTLTYVKLPANNPPTPGVSNGNHQNSSDN